MNLNASAKELKHRVEQLTERVAEFAEHEKKLRRSEGLLLAIMDHVPEGIVIVDAPDLKLRFASHYALCTIGSSPEEAKGAFGFFSRNPVFNPNGTPVDADSVLLRQVIENEELVKNLEVIVERPDGSRIPLLCNAAPVRDENKNVSGAIMSYMDVAERRRMEKELKKTHKELKTKVRQLSQQTVKLKTSEAHLHQLSSHLLEYQENERRRLANEIHDSVGQVLAAIKYRVESVCLKLQKSGAEDFLQPVKNLIPCIQACISDMRRLQMELRPTVLDDMGLVAAVEWFLRDFKETYPSITLDVGYTVQEEEVPEKLKLVIFRIVQEAVTNAGKHSDAEAVHISLRGSANKLVLTIEDNGCGFDVIEAQTLRAFGRGLGLSSMRERTQYSGGVLTIDSIPGKGTRIEARWTKKALA